MPASTSSLDGLSKTRRYLIGVSGGRDSVCLLDLLVRNGFRKLVVCHLDHGLRGRASAGDARFVEALAKSLGLECRSRRVETRRISKERKLSIETAARELRFEFFEEVAKEFRCRQLLLGHHADDQVETVFMNFCRGSGLAGLGGMRRESTVGKLTVIRPLLEVWRSEIDAYLAENSVRYRDDASNATAGFTRNRVRNKLLPLLPKIFGRDPRGAMLRAAAHCREDDAFLHSVVLGLYARALTKTGLSLRRLSETEPANLQRRVVRHWLRESGVPDCGSAEVVRVLSLLDIANGPSKVNLPGHWHARRRAGSIFLEKSKTS